MRTTTSLRNRAWLISLIGLANRAGLNPITKRQIHSLVFLANCLAPIYGEAAIESRVIKYSHGPFYPDAQWDLDRMVAQGIIEIEDVKYSDTDGEWWMEADYRITKRGEEVNRHALEAPMLTRAHKFLVELVNAFVSLDRTALESAVLQDAIYRTPGKKMWAALVFEDKKDNYAVITAETFSSLLPVNTTLSPKERIDLYLRYLGHLVRKTAQKVGEVQ